MKIMDFLNKKAISVNIKATDKEGVIRELADLLASATDMKNKEELIRAVLAREVDPQRAGALLPGRLPAGRPDPGRTRHQPGRDQRDRRGQRCHR